MAFKFSRRPVTAVIASLTVLAYAPVASAAQTCFTAFGGTVNIQFKGSIAAAGYHTLSGVEFGSLSPCAGLTHWPLVGAAYTESGSIVVAYRAESVDAASCGAVDVIANLTPATLTGPLQLHNDRTNFSNSDTLTKSTCVAVPPTGLPFGTRPFGKDSHGN